MAISPKRIYTLDEIITATASYKLLIDDGTLSKAHYITVANLLKDVLVISGGEVDFENADLVNVNDISFNGSINLIHYAKGLFTKSYTISPHRLFTVPGDYDLNNITIIATVSQNDQWMIKVSKPGWYKVVCNFVLGSAPSSSPDVDFETYDYDSGTDTLTPLTRYKHNFDEGLVTPSQLEYQYEKMIYMGNELRDRFDIVVTHNIGSSIVDYNVTVQATE